MQEQSKVREAADFLIKQAKSCKNPTQLEIVKSMLEDVILKRYKGETDLAHEYLRVDLVIKQKKQEFYHLALPFDLSDN